MDWNQLIKKQPEEIDNYLVIFCIGRFLDPIAEIFAEKEDRRPTHIHIYKTRNQHDKSLKLELEKLIAKKMHPAKLVSYSFGDSWYKDDTEKIKHDIETWVSNCSSPFSIVY